MHPHVGRLQVRERVCHVALGDRDVEAPARAQRAVEALRVEPRGGLDREALGAAGPQAVDQRHHPQLLGADMRRISCPAPGGRCSRDIECRQATSSGATAPRYSRWPLPPSQAAATPTSSRARAASRCPPATRFGSEGVRGYYIDLSVKAEEAVWPHPSLGRLEDRLWVRVHQWGLGAYERYLAGEGEQWLQNAVDVGRVRALAAGRGRRARRPVAQPPPLHEDLPAARRAGRRRWRRARARACSTRLYLETRDERYADGRAARRARDVAAQRGRRRAGAARRPRRGPRSTRPRRPRTC